MPSHAITKHHRDVLWSELFLSIGRFHSFDNDIEKFAASAGFHIVHIVFLDRVHVELSFGRCVDRETLLEGAHRADVVLILIIQSQLEEWEAHDLLNC